MSNVRIQKKEDNYHAWLSGDLNISSVNQVKESISEVLGTGPGIVVISFSDVEYVDSSAIAVLVSLLKTARATNTNLVFYDLKPDIRNIFEVACLDRFFNIVSNDEFEQEYKNKVL